MKAVIWTKNNCSFCDKAKTLLLSKGIQYEERNISRNYTKEELLKKVPNAKTVPQIFIDDSYVGGYTDLVSTLK